MTLMFGGPKHGIETTAPPVDGRIIFPVMGVVGIGSVVYYYDADFEVFAFEEFWDPLGCRLPAAQAMKLWKRAFHE